MARLPPFTGLLYKIPMNWANFLFSFRGRIARARYWLWIAIALPLYVLLAIVFWIYALSVPGAYENGGPTPLPSDPLGIAGAVLYFAVLAGGMYANTAITVKRLQDRDKAWWWFLVFIVAPGVLSALVQYLSESETANGSAVFVIEFAAFALTVWGMIELGFLHGTSGVNRFGPDPLAARASDA
jgi:uncharacterized membrane protein YhaH (DUF805 family)